MNIRNLHFNSTVINLLLSIYIVIFLNGPFWARFSSQLGNSLSDRVLLLMIGTAIIIVLNGLFSLFSFKYGYKPLLVSLLLISAIVNYYMTSYGIVINKQMITNLLETDFKESAEQITIPFFMTLLAKGGIPSLLLLFTRVSYKPWKKELVERTSVFAISLIALSVIVFANFKSITLFGRKHPELRMYINPTYPLYSFIKVISRGDVKKPKEPLKVIAPDATRKPSGGKSLLVLVVGETARAEQFSLNGYGRNTNPELATLDIYDFSNVQACGTDTAESLPCIFSDLGRRNYSRKEAFKRENLLDILDRTGVKVIWLDNNSGSKGVADRITTISFNGRMDPENCSSEECFDEIMLKEMDRILAENSGDMLLILHQKGSHGPSYFKRSPKEYKRFTPECTQDNVQDCDLQSIINAYDNTIVYTDHFLAKLISRLKKESYPAAMLYVSDHGESLGENNIYLHGMPYSIAPEQQTHVPMIFWASDKFMRTNEIDKFFLSKRLNDRLSHDYIFHTLLGLFHINSTAYLKELNIFNSGR